ncbi:hypothetical protein LTR28_013206 [Elasticomyces elasticus]|nr:hypothetical protein LTR28_013206 [Elasticomyces elasticus]
MASLLRYTSPVLRSSMSSSAAFASSPLKQATFNGARAYSSAKSQSLKETFAAKIPSEVEKIKKLRKCVVVAYLCLRSDNSNYRVGDMAQK